VVPALGRTTGTAIDGDHRWSLLARLLHDDTLDHTERVAGAFLLCPGNSHGLGVVADVAATGVEQPGEQTGERLRNGDVVRAEAHRHAVGMALDLVSENRFGLHGGEVLLRLTWDQLGQQALQPVTVWTRSRVSSSRRSHSIRSASSSPSERSTRRVLVRTATIAMEWASRASVLRLWLVSNNQTRAASLAGTQGTSSSVSSPDAAGRSVASTPAQRLSGGLCCRLLVAHGAISCKE